MLAENAKKKGIGVTHYALVYGHARTEEAGLKTLQPDGLADHATLDLSAGALAALCRRQS